MPRPRHGRLNAAFGLSIGLPAVLLATVSVAVALSSCADAGVGVPPPNDRIFFPSGMLLDPRPPAISSADGTRSWPAPKRWLFVANANSDLVFNGASVTAIDLDAFFSAWQVSPILSTQASIDDAPPVTDGAPRDDIQDVYSEVNEATPCRRNGFLPQLVECTEEPFVAAEETVHLGSFTTQLQAYQRASGDWQLMVPVRADPSIALIDLGGGLEAGDSLRLRCGVDGEARDPRRCSTDNRIRNLRNNPDYRIIGREPTNMLITRVREPDGQGGEDVADLAFVTHTEVPEVTLIGLGGLYGEANRGESAIIDMQPLFSSEAPIGGYGLAERPCTLGGEVSLCAADRETCTAEGRPDTICDNEYVDCIDGNEPSLTLGCSRPLIYAAHRKSEFILRMTVERVNADGQFKCVTAEELETGVAGGVLCEHRLVAVDQFVGAGVDSATSVAGGYGDIAFSRDGNSLYAVRNSVGNLIRIDTSLDERGETRDTPAAQVEVCAQPSEMVVFDDGSNEYAAISCYSPGTVFFVDLSAFRVIEQVFVGSGPHQMSHDEARQYLYVANTLDATISVVDLAVSRPTRFTEVARIGLQEPYSG
ncbi:MAG TPA: hypothetical protein ENK31_09965 [Nannocystis exedens]|nr:hypothetical protein [Nannocystis exedens]